MKPYMTPEIEMIRFSAEEALMASNNPLIDPSYSSDSPVEGRVEFGSVDLW